MSRKAGVTPRGCCLFLTDDELRSLDIDPEDDDQIRFGIEENGVRVTPVSSD